MDFKPWIGNTVKGTCTYAMTELIRHIRIINEGKPSSKKYIRRFVRRIQESEVREALKRMKGAKTMGPDDIPIEVWRCLGDSYSMANQAVQPYFSIKQDA